MQIACRARDDLFSGEVFQSLREALIPDRKWRRHYKAVRPHSVFAYRPPGAGNHCPNGPKADHPPKFNRDRSVGQPA